MAISAVFSANFTDLFAAVEKSKTALKGFQVDIEGVGKSLNKIGDQFSGQKIIQQATLTAKAIQDLGGYVRLTAAEQARANAIFEEAAQKMAATGDKGAAAMRALADATRKVPDAASPLVNLFDALKPKSENLGVAFGELQGTLSNMWANPTASALQFGGALTGSVSGGLAVVAGVAVGAGVAVATVGAAMFHLAEQAAQVGASLGDLSDKTGVSVPALSRMSSAADVAGTNVSELADAIYKMDIQAAESPEKFADGLNKLGINAKEFLALNPEDRLTSFAKALALTEDASIRNAAGFEVMGKQFKDMGPKLLDLAKSMELTAGITVWSKEQADNAEAFEMQVKALKLEVSDLGISIGRDLIPAMLKLIEAAKAAKDFLPNLIPEDLKLKIRIVTTEVGYLTAAWSLLRGSLNQGIKAEGLDDTTQKTKDLQAAMFDAARSPEKLREALLAIGKGATLPVIDLTAAWREATKANEDAVKSVKASNAESQKAAAAAAIITKAYEDLASVGKSYAETLARMDPLTRAFAIHMLEAGADAGALKTALALTDAQMKALTLSVKDAAASRAEIKKLEFGIQGLDEQIQKVGKSAHGLEVADAFTKAYEAVHKLELAGGDLAEAFKHVGRAIPDELTKPIVLFADTMQSVLKKIPDLLMQAFTGGGGLLGAVQASAVMAGTVFAKSLRDTIQRDVERGIPINIPVGAAGGVGAAAGVGALASGASATAALATVATAAFGTAAVAAAGFSSAAAAAAVQGTVLNTTMMSTALVAGAWTAGIGAAAVGVYYLAKHFLTVTQAEKDARKAFEDFNKAIGGSNFQDFISRVSAAGAVMGMNGEAVRRLLENLEQATHKNPAAVAAALKPLADLIDAADKKTADFKAGLDTLQRTGASSFNAIAKAVEGDRASLAALGAQAVTTFAALVASGVSQADAIQAIGPGLDSLIKSYDALGLSVDDVGLSALVMQSTMAKGNADLLAGVSGLASNMQALAQLGLLNVETFAAMEETGFAMYTRLQAAAAAAGGTTKDALLPMQQYLHQAEDAAKKLGIPLDDNTELLIEQSKELGIWKDEGKSAQDVLLDGMQKLVNKVAELIEQLNSIPHDITTTVHVNTETTASEASGAPLTGGQYGGLVTSAGIQRLARGGVVLPWRGKGTDSVLAMLTPGESVLTRAATTKLGASAVGRLNAGGLPAGGATVIDIEPMRQEIAKLRMDQARASAAFPKAIARAVRDELQRLVKR